MTNPNQPPRPPIDTREVGAKKDGERQVLDARLFMELLAFEPPANTSAEAVADRFTSELRARRIPSVLYADVHHPRGLALLTWSEDPAHFVRTVRPLFAADGLANVVLRPSLTMLGRTYSNGHEADLPFSLLQRPIQNVLNESYPWHVWYPLRRTGAFSRLPPEDQGPILGEHAQLGMAYGQADLAHDIRLACHGLDAEDNEFVLGLVGKTLHPLSHLVQTMRKTRQTSEFIAKMGPFFVGYVLSRTN